MPEKHASRTLREKTAESLPPRFEQEKVLYSWKAPSRPFKRRSRDFYVTLVAIAVLVGLILYLVEGFMPVLLLIAMVFLFYVLSTVPPEELEYQITTFGIRVGGKLLEWDYMGRFWYGERFGSNLLVVEAAIFGGRLEMIVDPKDRKEATEILSRYLLHEAVPASNLDKMAMWMSKKLPQS